MNHPRGGAVFSKVGGCFLARYLHIMKRMNRKYLNCLVVSFNKKEYFWLSKATQSLGCGAKGHTRLCRQTYGLYKTKHETEKRINYNHSIWQIVQL